MDSLLLLWMRNHCFMQPGEDTAPACVPQLHHYQSGGVEDLSARGASQGAAQDCSKGVLNLACKSFQSMLQSCMLSIWAAACRDLISHSFTCLSYLCVSGGVCIHPVPRNSRTWPLLSFRGDGWRWRYPMRTRKSMMTMMMMMKMMTSEVGQGIAMRWWFLRKSVCSMQRLNASMQHSHKMVANCSIHLQTFKDSDSKVWLDLTFCCFHSTSFAAMLQGRISSQYQQL